MSEIDWAEERRKARFENSEWPPQAAKEFLSAMSRVDSSGTISMPVAQLRALLADLAEARDEWARSDRDHDAALERSRNANHWLEKITGLELWPWKLDDMLKDYPVATKEERALASKIHA